MKVNTYYTVKGRAESLGVSLSEQEIRFIEKQLETDCYPYFLASFILDVLISPM